MPWNQLISLKKLEYYFSNTLGHYLYVIFNIIMYGDVIMEKRLISSYDKENDTFVGKIDGENGFAADYGISEGVYLRINNSHLPTSVFVPNASKVLNTSKNILESADVKIGIKCDESYLTFCMCIEDLLIFSSKCKNHFGIPEIYLKIDSNI